MKKIIAILLALVMTLTCVVAAGCIIVDLPTVEDHKHDFGDSYFTYVQCSASGCSVYGRSKADKYFSISDYTLDTQQDVIDQHYDELVYNIDSGDDQVQFDVLYDKYCDDVDFVVEQCDLVYLLSDVYASFVDKYYDAAEYYDKTLAQYYGLYELVYNSNYRDYFYDDWTAEQIQQARDLAARYNDSSLDQSEVRAVIAEYKSFMDLLDGLNGKDDIKYAYLNALYTRLVKANNAIAASAGYSGEQNYMDYAYDKVYKREYSPNDVTSMRSYVKQYVAPIFINVATEYYAFNNRYGSYFRDRANANYYEGLTSLSIVDTISQQATNFNVIRNTVDYVGNYFKYLSSVDGIDFWSEVNNLYRNGKYFIGSGTGAYTTVIKEQPVIYFQEKDYGSAFTFVHEFGHYYDFVVNSDLSASMDHSETQSQGNEMLFLAWLSNNKPSGISDGYTATELNKLFDFLSTIVLATAVDEFEQAAYSGEYNGQRITNYNETFTDILSTYSGANRYLNSDYWFYVVFENAAYYISYAMSALPAIELFAKANTVGLNSARDSYLKLFTYANDSSLVYDNQIVATYEQILNYCGLHSAFQADLYVTIRDYFLSRVS